MKKTKMVAVLSALVLGLVITSCENPNSGNISSENDSGAPEVSNDTLAEKLIDLEGYTLQVGDLIMSNNKVLPYSEDYTEEEWKNFNSIKPVAVIFREASGIKSVLGVGLQQPSILAWAKNNTSGNNITFNDIICTPKKDGEYSDSYWDSSKTWDGDIDGSDNWTKICAVDNTASSNPTNYPAFNYALTYGKTASLKGTYASNWFLPSIAELQELYTSKTKVNKVLTALGDKAQVIKKGWYWSSSQSCKDTGSAMDFNLDDSLVTYHVKWSDGGFVCVVRVF